MALVTSHTEPVILTNGLPSTPASPGSYFGWGLNATKSASTGPRIYAGAGSPNGILTAPQGSLWIDNTSAGVVYVNTTGAAVWGVLALAAGISNVIADPGDGAAIPVTASGSIALTIGAGAETNTMAIPTFVGQIFQIFADTVGGGTREITAASAINGAGNTKMTFNAARDSITLTGITVGGTRAWQINNNISVALS